MSENENAALSSEAGNTSRDRQPADADEVTARDREGPTEGHTASAKDVQRRSKDATEHLEGEHDQADKIHPGPNLDQSETKRDSLGG